MKRPAGVILSSIVLGLLAGLQLLSALITAVTIPSIRSVQNAVAAQSAYPPGTVPPPPGIMVAVTSAYAVFLVVLAAWAIVTLVGLVRLKNWARYSVLTIGGCMAGLGLLSVFGVVVGMAVVKTMPVPPNTPPHLMQIVFGVTAVFFAIFAGIGIWWLVYFNLRTTKAFFVPAYPVGYQPAHVLAPGASFPEEAAAYPPASSYPEPGMLHAVPTPVIVLACLFMVGGLVSLACMFLPYPAFFAGFTLSGGTSHALYIVIGLVGLWVGWGLIRLRNEARLATYGLMALGAVNAVVFLTPWCQARFAAYNAQLYERMHLPMSPAVTSMTTGPVMIFSVAMWLALYGVFVWILRRYRGAFVGRSL